MKLEGAVAFVTGASRGIGRATALALARARARVVLSARNAADLDRVREEIQALGGTALATPADVRDPDQVEAALAAARGRFGQIDVVVANAGVYLRRPVLRLTVEDVERSLAVNLYGILHTVLPVLPEMAARGSGHIVIMSSMDGRKALPGDAPYVMAKFALHGFADLLRQELGPLGIGVTGVYPGRVDTEMIEWLSVPWTSRKVAPEVVARAIVDAVRRDRAEVIVPGAGRGLLWTDLLSPRLADAAVRALRLAGRTPEADSPPIGPR